MAPCPCARLTAYRLAQPTAGAAVAKGADRVVGTRGGAAAGLVCLGLWFTLAAQRRNSAACSFLLATFAARRRMTRDFLRVLAVARGLYVRRDRLRPAMADVSARLERLAGDPAAFGDPRRVRAAEAGRAFAGAAAGGLARRAARRAARWARPPRRWNSAACAGGWRRLIWRRARAAALARRDAGRDLPPGSPAAGLNLRAGASLRFIADRFDIDRAFFLHAFGEAGWAPPCHSSPRPLVDAALSIILFGVVVFLLPAQGVEIAPDVSGLVDTVNRRDNQLVQKGDVLVVIDPARVELMAGGVVIDGVVEGLSRAIAIPGAGLLAQVNPHFDGIRLAPRLPVRIKLGPLPPGVRRVSGLSATVVVQRKMR